MSATKKDPLLLTPGPLTTTASVKQAMLHDWGSRDQEFIAINARMRERLTQLVGGDTTHVCVPLQGSGTFVVEATLGTLIAPDAKSLLLINGAYGQRMRSMLSYYQRQCAVLEWREDEVVDAPRVAQALEHDAEISHVAVVHCETTSGVLNPVAELARVVKDAGRVFLVDAMSSFGALELDVSTTGIDAVMASSNKCLQGVPGMGFAIVREELLASCQGHAPSLSLDLYAQWRAMEGNGQWRFTPPVHCIVAFERAIEEHREEGGVLARGQRYRDNCRVLVERMRAMGFKTLLGDNLQAPIIVTFHMPADPAFDFGHFYDQLAARGFVIYPGKLTVADSFRIGCIGDINAQQMHGAMDAVAEVLAQMGVSSGQP